MMKKSIKNLFLCAVITTLASFAHAQVVGVYDFEGSGTEFQAKNVLSGVTMSNLSAVGITPSIQAVGSSQTGMTSAYLEIAGDDATPEGTTENFWLTFTVTNNTGSSLQLANLNASVGGENLFRYSNARVFTDVQGYDSAVNDTIGQLGFQNETNGDVPAAVDTISFTNNTGWGANIAAGDFTLANGDSITFYIAWSDKSSSDLRWAEVDNLQLEYVIPTPDYVNENTLAVYDFEGTGTERFDPKYSATGITFSALSVNNLATTVEAEGTSGSGMASGNYLSIPGNSGTGNSTSTATAGGMYLSFSVTNNTGTSVTLTSLTATVGGNNIDDYFIARVFSDAQGFDAVIDDTIGRVGENPSGGGTASFAAAVNTIYFEEPEGANIVSPTDFILANGTSLTFYLVFLQPSSSASNIGEVDNIKLEINTAPTPAAQTLPNILCLSTEDMSPDLGCYGDTYVNTPNIDALASVGLLYNNAWSNAPACSPARTTLISGMHAPSTGGTSHRSNGVTHAPNDLKYYSLLLQELGYYTINNGKEDYNLHVGSSNSNSDQGWDSSTGGQWYNRPTDTTPFLAIYNYYNTHESRMNNGIDSLYKDYTQVPLSPIYPDIENIRRQLTRHYERIEDLDAWVKGKLDRLVTEGVEDDTIVLFYSDHGTCAPGGKRYAGNKGNRIPLIAYFPPKWAHLAPPGYTAGGTSDELVSFVDFAPTLLSIADEPKESYHQGRAFAGAHYEAPPANHYVHGYTDRMGERTWMTRSVFDGRYVYIRNYRPDQPHQIRTAYQWEETFAGDWEEMFLMGELTETQAKFFMPQGPEELYDLENDPHELNNLISDTDSTIQAKAAELRAAHLAWRSTYGDLAFLIEGLRYEYADALGANTPHHDLLSNSTYYNDDLLAAADRASLGTAADVPAMLTDLSSSNASIRHWALIGLMLQGRDTVRANEAAILAILNDTNESVYVRSTAAQVLATHGIAVNQTTALDYLFAQAQDNVHGNAAMNNAAERTFLKHMQAIDELPYIPAPYETQFDTFESSSGWTTDFKFHTHRNFYLQFNNPLAEFRHEHGLNRYGADDLYSESGDDVPNIFKFAFNIAPNEGDLDQPASGTMTPGGTSGLPVLFTDDGDGKLKYQFIRRKPEPDSAESNVLPTANMDYTAMTTSDLLGTWDPSALTPAVEEIDSEWERVTYTLPAGSDKLFYRLDVEP